MDTALKALYVAVASAIFSAITVIITIWRFTIERKKFNLEIEKLTKDLKKVELTAYDSNTQTEVIIYDGGERNVERDFSGAPYFAWSNEKKDFLKVMGEGSHSYKDGMINIERTNTEGRYSMSLQRYNYGNQVKYIPADASINGKRKFKLSCEVKSIKAEHTLSFVFKTENNQINLDQKEYRVFSRNWETVELAFAIDPDQPSYLRIDDIDVSKAPSSVQIKNIVLFEKKG